VLGENFQNNPMHASNEFAENEVEIQTAGHATSVTKQQHKLLNK
jgi:hypothetical protein